MLKNKRQKLYSLDFAGSLTVILLGLLTLSTLLTGCAAKKIILHPIEETDIAQLDQGESIRAPKRGFFISDYYMEEVMKAKVE